MTIRVLYLSDYAGLGGGETSLINLMEAMPAKGVQPVLHCTGSGRLTRLAESKALATEVNQLSRWKTWLRDIPLPDFTGVKVLQQVIESYQVDLVHCNSPEASLVQGALAARRAGVPFIWTCHGPWERPFGLRGRILAPYLSEIVCVSEWVASGVRIPSIEGRVVHPGITKIVDHVPNQVAELANLPQDSKKIALVGRFQKIKGQDLFVDAALSLIENGHDGLYFLLIGGAEFGTEESDNYERMLRRIEQTNFAHRFLLTGRLDVMPDVYASIDLVVVASEAESFSMVTLEAMAAGVTPVVMDTSAPQEITAGDRYGYMFRSGDSDSLARSVLRALEQPIDGPELKSRAARFSIESCADKMLQIYQQSRTAARNSLL